MATFRWGIIGPGAIAHRFADALTVVPDAQLWSVGGRNREKVNAFADTYSVKNRYGSYREVAQDPDIDAVYVSTTHPHHLENVLLCIENSKPVVCEKPFAVNDTEAKTAFDAAAKKGVFVMEAMWTRLLPIYDVVEEWIRDGLIGKVGILEAKIGFCPDIPDENERHISPHQAGGALLDIGVYNIALAMRLLGQNPTEVKGLWRTGITPVDFRNAFLLGYESGAMAVFWSALDTITPTRAVISGNLGHISIDNFVCAERATLHVEGRDPLTVEQPHRANGFEYEIQEAMACVRQGKIQSDRLPWSWTMASMKIMTDLRRQWGLAYPMETTEE